MRFLRLVVAVVLSVLLYERLASLDQYVGPPLYRPLHFLGFLITGLVIYLVLLPRKKAGLDTAGFGVCRSQRVHRSRRLDLTSSCSPIR